MNLSTLTAADQANLAGLLAKLQTTMPAAAPAPKRKRKAPAESRIKYLTSDELDRFWRACASSKRDTAIFRVAFHRGLRASEIGDIQMSDLDLKRDRITIRRKKGSHGGEYHLCASEVRSLRAWLRERGTAPGTVFPSRRGTAISQQMLDVLMKRYCAVAGIDRSKAHTHTLKHACATQLLEKGFSVEDVQDHLGHANIANTMIYAKFTSARREQRDRRLRDW